MSTLFKEFDINGDGELNKDEFLRGCNEKIHVDGLQASDFSLIYNVMDLNKDQRVSINEFGMYLQSAEINV